jgi:hypothetical protein
MTASDTLLPLPLFDPESAPAAPVRRVRDHPALRPQPARNGDDFWPTPPCLITALIRFVLPEIHGAIWEPCAGDGRLVDAMRGAGRDVLATDLVPRGSGIGQLDFLHDDPPREARGRAIVTNGPFRELDRFLTRGRQLLDLGVASALVLLLRNDALTTDGRAEVLNGASIQWDCCWRPVWVPGTKGGGRWSCAWVLFRPGGADQTVLRRLRRRDIAP